MDLPIILKDLLKAQENFDSLSYSECFSDDAIVFDEGKTHKGKKEIKSWNEKTNEEYKTKLEAINLFNEDQIMVLTTKVSGTFDGSPIILKYKFKIENNKISELKISN
ncbi:ketosteroid isomerase-like protein [Chryseobacterium ginsenosidimutans]|uniref:nuclear transport factor 2 family protein n=1 Tax=Chryseobacterium ginsenosidimutans TaxID=687846 RepID=UPI0027899C52|nr:nuclear transport factor 2 family protein [Chryseobacterium ginsenosidimutans]MDQ0591797.1 ketosteroid isomerase-like protein [Chryseobacterium ginsenosidimutans]